MITRLSESECIRLLTDDPFSSFTYDGAKMLVDYLHEVEFATGEEIEFDRIAFRCEWTEYLTIYDACKDIFPHIPDFCHNKTEEQLLESLREQTNVLSSDDTDSVVVQEF